MTLDKQKTIVVFRKWPAAQGGDVIALFPELPGTYNANRDCLSYQHVGQHGAADLGIVDSTRLATPAEYRALARELRQIGYNLDIKVRCTYRHQLKRRAEIDRQGREAMTLSMPLPP